MKHKPRKLTTVEVTEKYQNNEENCIQFFFDIIFPSGFVCDECGCTHHYVIHRKNRKPVIQCAHCKKQYSLLAGTAFEQCKLSLFKIILGLALFFSKNKGISASDFVNEVNVNHNTACNFLRKCRIMMGQSNGNQTLESKFYEADVAYIGEKGQGKPGMGTEQQPFLVILATDKEGKYPTYVKTAIIDKDNKANINSVFEKKVNMSAGGVVNTDGKSTFSDLSKSFELKSKKIDYSQLHHRLYWLNKIVSVIKGNIKGIYHGVSKRDLPLFMNEQEWRYNHRYIGKNVLIKAQKYMRNSSFYSRRVIVNMLDKRMEQIKAKVEDTSNDSESLIAF